MFLCLAAFHHNLMTAAGAFQAKIGADPKYLPIPASAGMLLF